ncbi:hypothetical protein BY996DRAFT_6410774 [Phakopsora pachyrhizi]|nr:hypothetical protein BY996DRAFT_6410774 [Phakopsora pachyrhizi]
MMELDSEAIQTSKSKSTCQRQPWGKRTSTSKPQGSYVLNPQRVPAESFQAWQSMEDASDQTSIAQKVTRKQTTDSIPADGRAFFSLTNKRPSSYRLSSRNINYSDIESKRSKVNLRKPPCDIGPGDSQSPKNIEGTSNLHEIHSAPLSWTPRIKLGYPESLTEGEKLKNFENSGNLRPRAQSFHPGRIVPEIPYNYSTQDSMESTTEEQNDLLTSEKAGAEQLGSESLRERQGLSRAKKSNSHESLFLTQNGFSDSETESLKTLESREESPSLTKRTENPGIKQKRFTFSKKAQRFDSSPQERDTTVPNYGNSNHDELFGASYLRRSSSNVQRLNKPNDFITASVNISEYNTEVKLLNELVGKTSSSLLLRLRESLKESEKNKFNALKKHEEMATYKQKVKNVLQKISLKKSSMDENFGVVRRQVTEQIMLERLNSESCSKEISQLREQIKTSLKTFEDLSAQNFETFDNSIEENMKNGAKQQHSRRALELINDLNEDRRKSELENATLSQAEAANKTLEKFRIEGIDIQLQDCQIKATSLQSEVLSLNKTSIELSQELRYVKKRIQDGDNLREMETQKLVFR